MAFGREGQGGVARMPAGRPAERVDGAAPRPLAIGLVNSMPGEALRHTERQFRGILAGAAGSIPVELRLFSFDGALPAGAHYHPVGRLAAAGIDGLIVTGMPPRAAALRDEPLWGPLANLVEFAVDRAIPTVWSCLAAHAAVLHLDGIERRRLPEKLSGLVDCTRADSGHALAAGLPERWRLPHSRYNELPTDALAAHGYRLLSRSGDAGADLFVKDTAAPFLFCQGHPEYDAHALLREYHRDIRQFLSGGRDDYPAAPRGCFGREVTARLEAFRRQAERDRAPDAIAGFPMAACQADMTHGWRDLALGLYANWLAQVADRAARRPAAEAAARADRFARPAGPAAARAAAR